VSAKMIESQNKLLPGAELRRLRMGSYEARIEEMSRVVHASLGDEPFEIVATQDSGAVVYADGRFLRLELTEDGPSLTDLDVETFDAASLYAFMEREAGVVADLFLRGSVKSAVARLENLVPAVPLPSGATAKIEALIAAPRPWRRLFEARRDYIVGFIGEDAEALEEGRLRPNFGKLYDGSIEEGKLDNYEDRVSEGLGIVLDRLGQIRDEVGSALASATDALSESTEPIAALFSRFADDLYADLFALHESASHATEAVDDIGTRGKLCDTLAEGLYDREVASRFVVVVADKMVEAS